MTLWKKGYDLDREVEAYTKGDDPRLDEALIPFDCTASMAHAKVLREAGVITGEEASRIIEALTALRERALRGEFSIAEEEEDCHTAIENELVERLGDLGKKIHTARSRNDQVAAALRLYMKDGLRRIGGRMDALGDAMGRKIAAAGEVPMPGYTHYRKAMPSSFALWMGAFAESMEDNRIMLDAAYTLIDQNPLGSGAGYGIPVFDLDRELSTKELGFGKVQKNPLYVQNSRGKFEANVVSALANVMADLNRMAADLILFSMDELGFITLPRELCTGSSIMPQKLNPDVLELVRAGYHEVLANEGCIRGVTSNLISGYSRDLQRTKKPLMESLEMTEDSLSVMTRVIDGFVINRAACERGCTRELYATQRAYELVKKGVPFRDAYRQVAAEIFPDEEEA